MGLPTGMNRETRDEMTGFLNRLLERHEVSTAYVDSLVPTVEAIFSDLTEAHRKTLLGLVEESVIRQSQTEAIMSQASALLERMREINCEFAPSRPAVQSRRQERVGRKVYRPSVSDRILPRTGT